MGIKKDRLKKVPVLLLKNQTYKEKQKISNLFSNCHIT